MKLIWILLFTTAGSKSANILISLPFHTESHYMFLSPIGLELARRGHNVTVITPFKEKSPPPNYLEIGVDITGIWKILGMEKTKVFDLVEMSGHEFHQRIFYTGCLAVTEGALKSRHFQEFLKKDNSFDLVIAEQFYQEAFNVLAYKYNAPLALISTFGNCMKHNLVTGNPLQLATIVTEHWAIDNPRSFWGRLKNLFTIVNDYLYWRFWYLDKQEELIQKYIPMLERTMPSLYEIQRNTSLLLVNSHFSYSHPSALLPNVVEIGGMHLKDVQDVLPEELQKLLDESIHGFIYVNFGSNVKSSDLPEEKRKAFLKVFKRLNQTVLWKWEEDILKDQPSNVVIRKWMPQKEILVNNCSKEIRSLRNCVQECQSLPSAKCQAWSSRANACRWLHTATFSLVEFVRRQQTKLLLTRIIDFSWYFHDRVVAHPNIKVFFSHGGLFSTQEAIYYGVPIIGVPVYGDQFNNLLLIQEAGAGMILKFEDINEKNIENAINDVLNHESYLKIAQQTAKRFRDRPMTPLDTAIFWLEYIIRNKGADFMKNPARNLDWIAYNMFDVYAFLVLIIITLIMIITKSIIFLNSTLRRRNKEKIV